jgi:hypothetical protein
VFYAVTLTCTERDVLRNVHMDEALREIVSTIFYSLIRDEDDGGDGCR